MALLDLGEHPSWGHSWRSISCLALDVLARAYASGDVLLITVALAEGAKAVAIHRLLEDAGLRQTAHR